MKSLPWRSQNYIPVHASPSHCANCGVALLPEYVYCPGCSQKAVLHRLSPHEIAHDALHYFTHADRSIFALLKGLATRTGAIGREYVGGRRKAHFPPLNFFLIVGTLYVLVVSLLLPSKTFDPFAEHPELAGMSAGMQAKMIHVFTRQHNAIQFMNRYSNLVAMMAVPFISIIYWISYRRAHYNYTEHLVAGLYMNGFTNLLFALLVIPAASVLGIRQGEIAYAGLVAIHLLGQVGYNSVFYFRFLEKRGRRAAFKAVLVSLAAALFWFLLSASAVAVYIASGYRQVKGH